MLSESVASRRRLRRQRLRRAFVYEPSTRATKERDRTLDRSVKSRVRGKVCRYGGIRQQPDQHWTLRHGRAK
eukprot:1219361-Pleurochrysis_carterae.AAC.1